MSEAMTSFGMKIETNRKAGACLAVCKVAVVIAGMAGVAPGSQAEDVLAGLVDPTRPSYGGAAAGDAEYHAGPALQSTFVSSSLRRAVISGRSYAVGDKFGGAVIADIQPYEVVLKQAGRETRLRLLPRLAKETHVVKVPVNSQEGGQK